MATAVTYVDAINSQFGLKLIQDKIGYTSLTDISLSYAFVLNFDRWNLNFGLAGDVSTLAYDNSRIQLGNVADPIAYNVIGNKTTFDADLGIEAATDNLRAGLVIQKMFNVFSPNNLKLLYRNDNANLIYLLYRTNNNKLFNFGYGITGIQNVNLYQLETSVTTFIKYNPTTEPLQFGVSFSTGSQFGAHLGIFIDKNIKFLYSYDVNFGNFGYNSKGSHEVSIRIRLNRTRQWGFRNYWENNTDTYY